MIKNGDLPAMPIFVDGYGQFEPATYTGLTKREMFAMAAMQGILAAGVDFTLYSDNDVSSSAVIHADALLAELEKAK